jgi:TetR/AcrR family transcriptional regulator, repressor for uid operon
VLYSLAIFSQADDFATELLDPYAERILEAARGLLIEHGLRRTSLADIARAAGVSEATLYRRFATREELLRTLVAREATAFIARVDQRIGPESDPVERLVIAFVMFARSLRQHELVQRLLVTDSERLLPLLTVDGSPALRLATDYVLTQTERAVAAGAIPTTDPAHVAELLVRIAHSLVLTPQTGLPIDDDERLAALARSTLAPLAFERPGAAAERHDAAAVRGTGALR